MIRPTTPTPLAKIAALQTAVTLVLCSHAGGFSVSTRSLELPETGTVTNWLLHTPRATYAFMPPSGWKLEPAPGESRLIWVSKPLSRISLNTASTYDLPESLTNTVALTHSVTNRFPEARLCQTSACHTEAEKGTAFDLEWVGPSEERMMTRLAIVEVADSTFEFMVSAPSKSFSKAIPKFQALLTSFQVARRELP